MSDYVLTCKRGDNSDLFPDVLKLYVLKLYVPIGSKVLDMTWGNGVFWKKVPTDSYTVFKNDIDPERGEHHYDFRNGLPADWMGAFDAVVLDPPYLYTGGFKTMKDSIDRGYNNRARNENGINGVVAVDKMYEEGIKSAYHCLVTKGILVLKCQDQVMSGKQVWAHVIYAEIARKHGFLQEDLFVLMQNGQPTMRHKPEQQKHARRNHSYFLVFRRGKHE